MAKEADPKLESPTIPLDDVHHAPLPYQALAAFGAEFDATMSEINRSGQRAQKARALDRERRAAWQTLRNAEKRLIIDLFFVQSNAAVFGELDEQLSPLRRPAPGLPEVDKPSDEAVIAAIGNLPQIDASEMAPEGAAPAIAPDLWRLLAEIWPADAPAPAPLPPPKSFLEETT